MFPCNTFYTPIKIKIISIKFYFKIISIKFIILIHFFSPYYHDLLYSILLICLVFSISKSTN